MTIIQGFTVLIGVSLGEPHSSGTALHTCMCILALTSYFNVKISAFKYFFVNMYFSSVEWATAKL